jgi:glycosyltransferase involved in cell wall biosynthesis
MPSYQVLIPAYNAGKTLSTLLGQLQELPQKPVNVLVIDDGSDDSTSDLARSVKAQVYRFSHNRGKGRALRQGFSMLMQNQDADYIICMDADLQHPAESIMDLLAAAEKCNSQFVIGVRNRSWSSMPWARRLSNFLTSAVISILTGQKIKDSQCGFRLIAKDVLKEISMREDGFQFESEMLLQIAAKKIEIDQVPIPTIYNAAGSHIHHVQDTLRFILLIIREIGQRVVCSLKSKN